MKTKVTLVEWPRFPLETVFYLWEAARSNDPINETPEEMYRRGVVDPEFAKKVRTTFEKVVDSSIPIAENLNFVFLLEGVSISFREQMVRHRIGVKVGERLGVDMFPDIHDSTWWAQSMRVLDMGKFYYDDLYRMPDSIDENEEARKIYCEAMYNSQEAYKRILELGIPIEDSREVIPLGAQHRVSWGLNLSSLMHICKKRSCWIPQVGTWAPVIEGMINELSEKVDPYFRTVVTPPCLKGNEFTGCVYKLDNERRVDREDPLLPCPLYINHHRYEFLLEDKRKEYGKRYQDLEEKFGEFWGRDTETGVMK